MTRKFELINRILDILNSSRNLGELLNSISSITAELTDADSCFIYLHDRESNELILMGSSVMVPKVTVKLRLGEGIAGIVGKERKPIAISKKAYEDPRFKVFRFLEQDTYEAILSVPIEFNGNLVGVINIQHRKEHKYTRREILMVEMISKLVSGVLERDWLYEQYKKKAETLEKILESVLVGDEDLIPRLEYVIGNILKVPVKVSPYRINSAPIKSRHFTVHIPDGYEIDEEHRKALMLILNQADLIMDNRRLQDEIEERKLVEKAKGILMRRGLSEEEAYRFLRKKAMDTRKRLKDVAESIILSSEIFN